MWHTLIFKELRQLRFLFLVALLILTGVQGAIFTFWKSPDPYVPDTRALQVAMLILLPLLCCLIGAAGWSTEEEEGTFELGNTLPQGHRRIAFAKLVAGSVFSAILVFLVTLIERNIEPQPSEKVYLLEGIIFLLAIIGFFVSWEASWVLKKGVSAIIVGFGLVFLLGVLTSFAFDYDALVIFLSFYILFLFLIALEHSLFRPGSRLVRPIISGLAITFFSLLISISSVLFVTVITVPYDSISGKYGTLMTDLGRTYRVFPDATGNAFFRVLQKESHKGYLVDCSRRVLKEFNLEELAPWNTLYTEVLPLTPGYLLEVNQGVGLGTRNPFDRNNWNSADAWGYWDSSEFKPLLGGKRTAWLWDLRSGERVLLARGLGRFDSSVPMVDGNFAFLMGADLACFIDPAKRKLIPIEGYWGTWEKPVFVSRKENRLITFARQNVELIDLSRYQLDPPTLLNKHTLHHMLRWGGVAVQPMGNQSPNSSHEIFLKGVYGWKIGKLDLDTGKWESSRGFTEASWTSTPQGFVGLAQWAFWRNGPDQMNFVHPYISGIGGDLFEVNCLEASREFSIHLGPSTPKGIVVYTSSRRSSSTGEPPGWTYYSLLDPETFELTDLYQSDRLLNVKASQSGNRLAFFRPGKVSKQGGEAAYPPITILDLNGTCLASLPEGYSTPIWLGDRYLIPVNPDKDFLEEPVVFDVEEQRLITLRKEG